MGYKYEDIFKLESLIEDRITTIKDRPSVNADQNGVRRRATIIAKFSK